jgi:hypothetical protein
VRTGAGKPDVSRVDPQAVDEEDSACRCRHRTDGDRSPFQAAFTVELPRGRDALCRSSRMSG